MVSAPKAILLAALLGARLALAVPIEPPPTCNPHTETTVTDQHQYWAPPTTAGVSCQSSPAGCTVGQTKGYSVGVTWTAGGSLGLSLGGLSASIAPSWSYSTTTSTSDTGTAACPDGPWNCGLAVSASMLSVSGQATGYAGGQCTAPPSGPYTVTMPIKNADGNADINVAACTCPDLPGSDASGAPEMCPTPCGGGP
jgi:hypothetical protein